MFISLVYGSSFVEESTSEQPSSGLGKAWLGLAHINVLTTFFSSKKDAGLHNVDEKRSLMELFQHGKEFERKYMSMTKQLGQFPQS